MRLTSTNYIYHLQKVLNESLDGMEKRLKSKQKVYKHMDINVMIFFRYPNSLFVSLVEGLE